MNLVSSVFRIQTKVPKQVSFILLLKKNMTTGTEKSSILNWASKDGEFRRQQSTFRDMIEADENAKFAAEP